MPPIESFINSTVQWLRLAIETIGVVIIVLGVVLSAFGFLRTLLARQNHGFNAVRLQLGRYLSLGLEFQLGADILSTAIAPSWDEIGKLAAIAVIRTGLNYFLMQEMNHERATMDDTTDGTINAASVNTRADDPFSEEASAEAPHSHPAHSHSGKTSL